MADSDNPATGSKRRRISLACNACRTRKSRCDGNRPTCATCTKLGFDCQFDAPDSSTNIIVQKEYVSGLEHRLRKVEDLLQRHDDLLVGHLSTCAPRDGPVNDGTLSGESTAHLNRGNEIETTVLQSIETDSETEARTDGLAITFVDEHAGAYFGESSNIAFVRYLLGAIASIWGVNKPEQPQMSDKKADKKIETMLPSEQSQSETLETTTQSLARGSRLPAPNEMETMMDRYFNTMGLLFSFLHEATFRREYNAFEESGYSKVGKTWLGKLNLIFAISSNINRTHGKTSEECFGESLVFYRRAMSLCGTLLVQSTSLDIVQLLLLQVLYLQGTPQAGEAWSIHGLLVRSATALGMHNDKIGRQLDPIVQEMRVRTWHTIYCLDTVLTATFGRPCSVVVGDATVRLPEPWLVHDTTQGLEEIEAAICATDFLFHSVQLYRIMGKSIEIQYKGNNGAGAWQDEDESAMIQTAHTLYNELRQWAANLPSAYFLLSAEAPDLKRSSRMNKLRTILTVRYHSVSMLIHRPLLCASLRQLSKVSGVRNTALTYTAEHVMEEASTCITSAEVVIGIAVSVLGDGPVEDSNLGVWFFTLYYVFTAALMICGGMLCARVNVSRDADKFVANCRVNLISAADALENIDNENPTVKRCVKYIRYLAQLRDNRADSGGNTSQRFPEANLLDNFASSDFMGMVDLLDDNSGLGPYLAAELFDSSNFNALTLPFQ